MHYAAVGIASLIAVLATAGSSTALAHATVRAASTNTNVYDLRGKVVFTLTASLCESSDELCADGTPGRKGTIYVRQTHNTLGGVVPVPGTSNWKAWCGRKFLGTIVKRDRRHADTYSRTGRKTGYAIGPYPVRAAAVYVVYTGC